MASAGPSGRARRNRRAGVTRLFSYAGMRSRAWPASRSYSRFFRIWQRDGPRSAHESPMPGMSKRLCGLAVADLRVCRHLSALREATLSEDPEYGWRYSAATTRGRGIRVPQLVELDVCSPANPLQVGKMAPPRGFTERHAARRRGFRRVHCHGSGADSQPGCSEHMNRSAVDGHYLVVEVECSERMGWTLRGDDWAGTRRDSSGRDRPRERGSNSADVIFVRGGGIVFAMLVSMPTKGDAPS